jgi:uncharacterized alkaline shock family protein YloU
VKEEERPEAVEVSREAVAALAAQAASGVEGVLGCQQKTVDSLASMVKREYVHHGVKVDEEEGSFFLTLYLRVAYGVSLPATAEEVRRRVREYVEGVAKVRIKDVEVVVEDVEPPA